MRIIVIGGGAAGLMAAIAAKENAADADVVLIEKNDKLGKKIFITGKGRGNLTNAAAIEDFFPQYVTNPRFLYSALYDFTNQDTIDLLEESTALRDKVHENARYFRAEMEKLGFDLLPGEHPIVPVMLYDPKIAQEFARRMLEKGVYVVGFCYPVVPKGRDRIRTQISAGHTKEDLDFAVRCFGEVKKEMGL